MPEPAERAPGSIAAVVIGCSTGGPQALATVLGRLRADLRTPLIVVCHRAEDASEDLMTPMLAQHSRLPVVEAVERTPVQPGVVHLAPSGYHLLVESDHRFTLSADPRVRFVRPSVDVLFESAARAWRTALLAVLLTGANDDGADGLCTVRRLGGWGLVQDPETAIAPQMPRAALARAGADAVLSLDAIAQHINQACR